MQGLVQAAGLLVAVGLLGTSSQLEGCGGPIGWIHRLEKWPISLTKSKMYTSDQEAQFIIPFEEKHKPQAVQIWIEDFFESGNKGSELLTVATFR